MKARRGGRAIRTSVRVHPVGVGLARRRVRRARARVGGGSLGVEVRGGGGGGGSAIFVIRAHLPGHKGDKKGRRWVFLLPLTRVLKQSALSRSLRSHTHLSPQPSAAPSPNARSSP